MDFVIKYARNPMSVVDVIFSKYEYIKEQTHNNFTNINDSYYKKLVECDLYDLTIHYLVFALFKYPTESASILLNLNSVISQRLMTLKNIDEIITINFKFENIDNMKVFFNTITQIFLRKDINLDMYNFEAFLLKIDKIELTHIICFFRFFQHVLNPNNHFSINKTPETKFPYNKITTKLQILSKYIEARKECTNLFFTSMKNN